MSPFDFFKKKVCLSLNYPDWEGAMSEFRRVGMFDVKRFRPLPIHDRLSPEDGNQILGPHQSFNGSVNRIIYEFKESGEESLLFLEDDCVFRDYSHLEAAIKELPGTWDILYLGANLCLWNDGKEPRPERYSQHLFRVKAAWTTHAVAFRQDAATFILQNQPGFSECMIDNFLSSRLADLNAYVVAPMIAYQRPHHSTIWVKPEIDDYTAIFEESDKRLR